MEPREERRQSERYREGPDERKNLSIGPSDLVGRNGRLDAHRVEDRVLVREEGERRVELCDSTAIEDQDPIVKD